jgi:outer membrane protein assembly factor BamB
MGVVLALASPLVNGAQAQNAAPGAWISFQGGPGHPGASTSSPAPPLKVAWRSGPSGDARLSGAVLSPGVAVATGVKSVVGLDPSSGAILWTVGRAQGPLVPPAVDPEQGSHGIVVFTEGSAGGKGAVTAVDLSTRARLWSLALPSAPLGAPTIADGRVFFGTFDGSVYALNEKDGSQTWPRVRTDGAVYSSPAVGDGKVFAVSENSSSGGARLYAIDAATGRAAWSFSPGRLGVFATSPSVIAGSVFEGFGDRSVVALDTASGVVRWKQLVRGDFSSTSAPAVSGGALFVADREGGLYRFDARTGARAWDFQFSDYSVASAPLVAGDMVFQGLDNGTIAAVSVSSGRLRWRTRTALGAIGPFTPDGDLLLAPAEGTRGGILALRRDPSGTLIDLTSSSSFRPPIALRNFGAAFVLMLLVILGFFTLIRRRSQARADEGDRSWSEEATTP